MNNRISYCRPFGVVLLLMFSIASAQWNIPLKSQKIHLPKIDAILQSFIDTYDEQGEDSAIVAVQMRGLRNKIINKQFLVPVIIEPTPDISTKLFDGDWLSRRGIVVDAVSRSYIRAQVPLRLLRRLSDHPQIRIARAPTPCKALGGLGSKVSESVALTNAAALQSAGINGVGQKIAIVDLGFQGIDSAIARGELGSNTVKIDLAGAGIQNGEKHGVGVAEHAADMAPGAQIYCICVGDEVDLQNAADTIKSLGIHIANHSVGWAYSSYYDDTGPINKIINDSHDSDNVFWAVAAGNDAKSHWRGGWSDIDIDNVLNFSGSDEGMEIYGSTGYQATIFLNWNQYGEKDTSKITDLDIYVYDGNDTLVAYSNSAQKDSTTISREALSFIYGGKIWTRLPNKRLGYYYFVPPYNLIIHKYKGPTSNLDMTIFTFGCNIEYAKAGNSLMDPADAHGAFSVAAISKTKWNNQSPVPEWFSSQGRTNDGRMKPDISAPDSTQCWRYGNYSAGTSFSSPTTAGAAALMLQQIPSLSANAVADTLRRLAVDIGIAGHDSVFGAGKLRVDILNSHVNHPPVAVNDNATVNEDNPVICNVLRNDSDPDGDPVSISTFSSPAHGIIERMGDSSFQYTPYLNYNGSDVFVYVISDGKGGLDTASVLLTINPVNDAPVITNAPSAPAVEHQPYSFTFAAQDPENGVLSWSLTDKPSGMTINPSTGVLTWTPGEGVTTSGAATVTATDDGTPPLSGNLIFTISVTPVNDPPAITSLPVTAATEHAPWSYAPTASDPERGALAWSISGKPADMTFNPSTGALTWTPGEGVLTSGPITLAVTDNGTPPLSASQTFTIAVTPVNDPPVITTTPITTATEDIPWSYAPAATDPEHGTLSWDLDNEPSGMTIDPATGAIHWTPGEGVLTSGPVLLSVKDNGTPQQMALQPFEIIVTPINDPPAITTAPAITATEDEPWSYAPAASDPEHGTLIWNISGKPDGMTFNPATGAMAWTPGEGILTSGEITLTVADNGTPPLTATQTFTIAVTPVNDPPVITTTPATAATEDVAWSYAPAASDPEHGTLVWSISGKPDGMTFNPATGAMAWTPGEGILTSGAVMIRVTDNGTPAQSATQSFTIAVTPVNDAPVISSSPVITGTEDIQWTYAPAATDAENGVLTWSLVAGPSGMSINATTGAMAWTPTEGVLTSGTVTIRVTDNGTPAQSASQSFTITVTPVNDAPVIATTPPTTAIEHAQWTYAPSATDIENNSLTWHLDNGPPGMTCNEATGAMTWTPGEGVTSSGLVVLRVTDNGVPVQTAGQAFTITVTPVNDVPVISTTPVTTGTEDVVWTYAPAATDPENGALTWSLVAGPSGMSINATTGAMAWTPTEGVLTSGTVTIRVTDNGTPAQSTTQSFTIAVTPVNDAPVISSSPVTTGTEDIQWTYAPAATDAENGVLTWSLVAGPSGISINATTGAMAWTPTEGVLTSGTVTIRVTDNGTPAKSASQTFTIAVTPVNDAPTISLSEPSNGARFNEGSDIRITADAHDIDGTVARVAFYDNAALLGEVTAAPFVYYMPATGGAHQLSAKAIDNQGAEAVSAPISISVNRLPSVSLTAPANGASYREGVTIALSATASDNDGSITAVEFYDNGILLSSDNVAPYEMTYSAASVGPHSLTARAIDNEGAATVSVASAITVIANLPPAVKLTRPIAGATITQSDNFTLTATASDPDGKIAKVEFYQGTTLLATDAASPYSWTWTKPALGSYALTTKAYDDNGVSTTSAAVTVSVNAPGEYYFEEAAGTCVMEAENYSQTNMRNDTIAFQPGNTSAGFIGAGYMVSPDLPISNSAWASSSELAFRVNINTPGTYYLGIRYRALDSGDDAWVGGLNNVQKGSSYYNAGVTTTFKWTRGASLGALAAGIQTVQVRRYETGMEIDRVMIAADSNALPARNSTEAGPAQSVRWKANVNPAVSITQPVDGATFNFGDAVALQASASDPDGNVTRVEYYNGATLIGQSTAAPYAATWSNVTGGAHTLTAKAIDNRNGSTVSAPITINVTGNQMPLVGITLPTAGMVVKEGFDTTVSATASDLDGTIAHVEFFDNGASIGVDNASPYQVRWRPSGIGAHSLTARATDNLDGSTLSLPVTVTAAVNKAPVVTLTRPLNGASITLSDNFILVATATDADGKIAHVDFYQGTTKLYADATSPYGYTWSKPALGTYVLTAKAYDDNGAVTTSASVTVSVNAAGASYFDEQAGICVMEAEHYSQINLRSDTLAWQLNTTSTGYSSEGYMATPDVTQAATNSWAYSSEIAYRVNITTPGTYYIGIRRRAPDGTDDHGYAGVNNVQKGSYAIMGITSTWKWTRGGSLGVLAAGAQTIQVRRYDNGLEVDRVMIATDSTMLPARESPDAGPAESMQH